MVKAQDVSYVFSYVSNYNPIGRYLAWGFMKEKWNIIEERYAQKFRSSHLQLFHLKATIAAAATTTTTTTITTATTKWLLHLLGVDFADCYSNLSENPFFRAHLSF